MVLCVVALTSYTVSVRNTTPLVNSAQTYFFCEQNGHNSSEPCNLDELKTLANPAGTTLAYILLMGFFPAVNMVYIVNIEELKEMWKKCLVKKRHLSMSNHSAASTVTK